MRKAVFLKLEYIKAKIPVMAYGRAPLLFIIAGRIGVALAGIIAIRVSTDLLSPDQQGSLSQLSAIVNLFSLLLVIPVVHFMNRGFLEWFDAGKLKINTIKFFFFLVAISAFAFILSSVLQWKFSIIVGMGIFSVAFLISMFLLIQNISNYGINGFNLFGQRPRFVIFSNIVAWSSIVFSVILFNWYKSPFSWSLGQVIGFLIGCFSIILIWRNLHPKNALPVKASQHDIHFNLQAIFIFSWPILISSGLGWLQLQSYKFILDYIQGIKAVGLFSVAYGLAATPINIYQSIISQYLDPIFFDDLRQKTRESQIKAWNNYARLYLPGLIFIGILIAVAAPFMARILLGEAYRAVAIKITVWAAIIETLRASGGLLLHLGFAKVDNRMTIVPSIVGAILAPLGIFFFGRINPLYGTIAGLLLAGLVVFAITLRMSYKILPITWPFQKVLQTVGMSTPLLFGLPLAHFIFPQPGFLSSVLILSLSGIYSLLILSRLLSKKETDPVV